MNAHRGRRRAFALPELAAIILVALLLLAFLLITGQHQRRQAQLGQDILKLHVLGFGTALYGCENHDQICSLSWKGGVHYNSPWPELNFADSDIQAQANQAIEILRRREGRTDIPQVFVWIPNILYSHLALADFLDAPLPWLPVVSSMDADRLRWAGDPACYDANCFLPCQQSGTSSGNRRWPYSASFQVPPAIWDRGIAGARIAQGPSNNTYFTVNGATLGPGHLSDVAHPHAKVHMHDEFARFFGGPQTAPYFAHPEARLPLLFFDATVRLERTADANPGWQPNSPSDPAPTTLDAFIQTGQCIPGVGSTYAMVDQQPAPGVFRWTRCGLDGRDFGPETFCSTAATDTTPPRLIAKPQTFTP
jgi:hypothetical protein